MTRTDEIKSSIEYINKLVKSLTEEPTTQEQITNINLAAIAHNLADINLTLAIVADKLGGEEEEG